MSVSRDIARLNKMLHNYQAWGSERNWSEQELLSDVVSAMKQWQFSLRIPDRSIAVMDYLARNERALIIPDKYTTEAFEWARKALEAR